MLDKIKKWSIGLLLIILAEVLVLILAHFLFMQITLYLSLIFLTINGVAAAYILFNYQNDISKRILSVSQILGNDSQQALQIGKIGIMTYNDEYEITWVSELFEEYQKELISKKVAMAAPGLKDLFSGDVDEVEVYYKNAKYLVIRKNEGQILFWQDITLLSENSKILTDNQVVIGLIHLDNYNETVQNEDEQVISLINNNLRQPIDRWAKSKGILIRRLRSDRFMMVLNEVIYQDIEQEYFPILDQTRIEAQKINVPITISMVFARGSYDLSILDDMASNLLDLTQSRGGDQVAMRVYQHDTKFFGGRSEAVEKRSKVKARVMARTIKELISESDEVFIVGHRDIDFDCFGAMLGISRLAQEYNSKVYAVTNDISYDEQLERALNRYQDSILDKHQFISEEEGLSLLSKKSLVICVDHHHLELCSAPSLISRSKRLVVIDHHRRGENFFDRPILVYVEASASSTSELVAELIEYQPVEIELEPLEATLMLTGLIVDTNHFRIRSGTRTFAAASFIKAKGADVSEADAFLKENYDEFEKKNRIFQHCEMINDEIIVAAVDDEEVFNRTLISRAADSILNINDIEAVFVIANSDNDNCVISARSKGYFNVQFILEKMNGGGHFSAAGLQRTSASVSELKTELLNVLKENENESNFIE